MAEREARYVRCPKCANLLLERSDYSVYRCGGCDTVLKAKTRATAVDCLSANSGEERAGEVAGNLVNSPETGTVSKNDASEVTNLKSSGSFKRDQRLSEDHDGSIFNSTVDEWVAQNDFHMKSNSEDLGSNSDLVTDVGQIKTPVEISSGSVKYEEEPAVIRNRVEVEQCPNTLRSDVEGARCSTSNSNYLDEGSSSDSHMGPFYNYGYALRNGANLDIHNRVESLNQDQAELLRKLDELRDQLTRSCNLTNKLRETTPQDAWLQDGSRGLVLPDVAFHGGFYPAMHNSNYAPVYGDPYGSGLRRRGAPQTVLPKYNQQPPHPCFPGYYVDTDLRLHNLILNQSSCSCLQCYERHWEVPGPVPPSSAFCKKRLPDVPNAPTFYHCEKAAAFHLPGQPQACNPSSASIPSLSMSQDSHGRWSSDLKSEMDQNRPKTMSVRSPGRHCLPLAGGAPFITCWKCFQVLQIPKKVLAMEKNKRKMKCAVCSAVIVLSMVEKKHMVVSPLEDTKTAPCEVSGGSYEVPGSMNICSDDTGCGLQSENRDHISPSAGQNVQSIHSSSVSTSGDENYPHGMELPGKGLTLPPPPPGSTLQEYFDYSSNKLLATNQFENGNQGLRCKQDKILPDKTPLRTNSFGHLIGKSSMNVHSNESGPDVQTVNSTSLGNSRSENFPDDSVAPRGSRDVPVKRISSPSSPPRSPLQERLIYSSDNLAANRFGAGNRSMRLDQENMSQSKTASRQSSIKDVSLETETEVSFNEYSTTETSQGSIDVSGEDQPRINKNGDSFFTGILRKKSFSKSNQSVEVMSQTRVTVNDHPVSDILVQKAEKLAGPIHPGNFWYDSRAGFWGVMGGPCLGIIPPSIEEFNYPMPEKCAGGDTRVFVNGRELHQKDMNLLVKRGLPADRDRSYIVDISGKVQDKDSGEELKGLGALAPTVMRTRRGFGMRVRRAAAA